MGPCRRSADYGGGRPRINAAGKVWDAARAEYRQAPATAAKVSEGAYRIKASRGEVPIPTGHSSCHRVGQRRPNVENQLRPPIYDRGPALAIVNDYAFAQTFSIDRTH